MPGDGESVAAVIAPSAQHHDALAAERRKLLDQQFNDTLGGILHQNNAGNAKFDGAAIHLAHLGGSEDFHVRTPVRICSSRCRLGCSPMTTR